jgi:hypothetical protein
MRKRVRNFFHKSIELSNLKRFFVLLAPGIIVLGTGVRFVHFHAGFGRLRARIWRAIVAPDRIDDIPPVSVKVEINPHVEATSKECCSDDPGIAQQGDEPIRRPRAA